MVNRPQAWCFIPTAAFNTLATTIAMPSSSAQTIASMSRKGNCYDNAAMESFWSTLKHELIYRRHFKTRAEARQAIFDFIEVFYNRRRLHSSLGYRSPIDFENQNN